MTWTIGKAQIARVEEQATFGLVTQSWVIRVDGDADRFEFEGLDAGQA